MDGPALEVGRREEEVDFFLAGPTMFVGPILAGYMVVVVAVAPIVVDSDSHKGVVEEVAADTGVEHPSSLYYHSFRKTWPRTRQVHRI